MNRLIDLEIVFTYRWHFLFASVSVFATTCSDVRDEFKIAQPFPLLQSVIIDAEAGIGGKIDPDISLKKSLEGIKEAYSEDSLQTHENPGKGFKMAPGVGLLTPVTEDGFCLTAAHVVGKGKYAASQSNSDMAFALVDIKEQNPVFLIGEKNGKPKISGLDVLEASASVVVRGEGDVREIEVIPVPLTPSDYRLVRNEIGHIDAVFLIPIQVIKVWDVDDLALVKVPFPTPSYFPISKSGVSAGKCVMVFGNPLVHNEGLNLVTERVDNVVVQGSYSEFVPMVIKRKNFLIMGDSGGPLIDKEGCVVGIHHAEGYVQRPGELSLAISVRFDSIMKEICKARTSKVK